MLMVTTRYEGAVADRLSEKSINELRAKGRRLLERATDSRAIARFLTADAFYPFWLQMERQPEAEEIAEAEETAERAVEVARKVDEPELVSAALDALGGIALTRHDWAGALEITRQRLVFEDRLGLYERLDARSLVAWMSYLMGDLVTADQDSADMVSRLLPGQAPFAALHLYVWRTLTLLMLGRWDEGTSMFWRCIEAWNDAGRHAAGYSVRGFMAGLDIARARGDGRVESAALEAILSILNRYPANQKGHGQRNYLEGDAGFASDEFVRQNVLPEILERRLNLANDRRQPVPASVMDAVLERGVIDRIPLLEAQARRSIGLAHQDASQMTAALEIWERIGAVPSIGRAKAERGWITGDAAETEAGLAILKKLGDVNYVDRFTTKL
jgi:tetratricopeptide (TPR) repeat protein